MKIATQTGAGILLLSLMCTSTIFAVNNQHSQLSIYNNEAQMQSTQATKNKTEGEDFLAKNKLEKDVVTLPDGLRYKIVTEGSGVKPTDSDVVLVDYAGRLIDGTEFDSSYKRGEPASFPVNRVIAGWTEALKLMSVGSVWELYIPAELAYGTRGMPPIIGPSQTLIFKVSLLGIKK